MRRRSSTWSADCDSSYAWLSTLTCVPSWYDDAASSLETGAMTVGRSGAACGTVVDEQSTAACANPGTTIRHSRSTRSEEHTSELQSLIRISYAVFCLKKKKTNKKPRTATNKQIHSH